MTLSASWLVTKFSLEAVQRLEAAQWQIRGKTGINYRGKKLSVPRLEIASDFATDLALKVISSKSVTSQRQVSILEDNYFLPLILPLIWN